MRISIIFFIYLVGFLHKSTKNHLKTKFLNFFRVSQREQKRVYFYSSQLFYSSFSTCLSEIFFFISKIVLISEKNKVFIINV